MNKSSAISYEINNYDDLRKHRFTQVTLPSTELIEKSITTAIGLNSVHFLKHTDLSNKFQNKKAIVGEIFNAIHMLFDSYINFHKHSSNLSKYEKIRSYNFKILNAILNAKDGEKNSK